jgi:hypothetical protein
VRLICAAEESTRTESAVAQEPQQALNAQDGNLHQGRTLSFSALSVNYKGNGRHLFFLSSAHNRR